MAEWKRIRPQRRLSHQRGFLTPVPSSSKKSKLGERCTSIETIYFLIFNACGLSIPKWTHMIEVEPGEEHDDKQPDGSPK